MDVLKTGTILIEQGTVLPKSLLLTSEPYSTGWTAVTNVRAEFEKDISRAGWTFFFLAGTIRETAFGFDKQKAVHTAVERILADLKSQECNCLEITGVTMKSFLGMSYACVTGHSRHIQGNSVFQAAG